MGKLVQQTLVGIVRAYRYLWSPWRPSCCRFEPSCSAYALQALTTHGACTGSYLALARVLRCHPWGAFGHDPVPTQTPRFLSRSRPCAKVSGPLFKKDAP